MLITESIPYFYNKMWYLIFINNFYKSIKNQNVFENWKSIHIKLNYQICTYSQ
jgi:hypothetical protein